MPRDMGGYVIISYAEIHCASHNSLENCVKERVEKYFFDTPPTGQTVDKSTFIEGGRVISMPVIKEKEDFYSYIESHLIKTYPAYHINRLTEGEQETFVIQGKKDKELQTKYHAENDWMNYQKDHDIDKVLSKVNFYFEQLQKFYNTSFDIDQIVPVIRAYDKSSDSIQQSIKFPFAGELNIFLLQQFDGYKIMIPETWSSDKGREELYEQSLLNVIKRGWAPSKMINSPDGGIASFWFFESNEPYQGQFLIKKWTKEKFGKTFYISFPTRYITLVLTIDQQKAKAAKEFNKFYAIDYLVDKTQEAFRVFDHSMSLDVFKISHEDITKI